MLFHATLISGSEQRHDVLEMYVEERGMRREGVRLTSPCVPLALCKHLKHDPNDYGESRARLAVTIHVHEPEGDALADCKVCGGRLQ